MTLDRSIEEYVAITERLNAMQNTSLRDQFAMAALTGICAPIFERNGTSSVNNGYLEHAFVAYGLADAMLKARETK